ncbi:MAG: phosphohydrolase [Clostridia bacterium]|nr:phosphohydrolase [Clostridia bacterium]
MSVLCIYHGNCADGFGAAWAVYHRFRSSENLPVEFVPGVYGNPPPDVTGRHVLMVDFSYKRPVLLEMAGKARSIVILDHHKTAVEDLAGFREPAPFAQWQDPDHMLVEGDAEPIAALFDMDRSGAGITWDFFFPHEKRPRLIDHIEDRDLWRFNLDGTREIQAAVFSYPYDFETWDRLMLDTDLDALRAEGRAIERKHFKDIDELLRVTTRRMVIGGFNVPVANLPYTLTSDAGHKLANGEPFGVCYWDTPEGRVFSLRSTDAGEDVSAIAKTYGGGGHRNASGFRMPAGWEGDLSDKRTGGSDE